VSQIKITVADNQQLISKWCQTQEKYKMKHFPISTQLGMRGEFSHDYNVISIVVKLMT
jgi:hypothetical protein